MVSSDSWKTEQSPRRPSTLAAKVSASCEPDSPGGRRGSLSPVPTADRRLTCSGQQLPAADQEPTLFQRRRQTLNQPTGMSPGPPDTRGGAWPGQWAAAPSRGSRRACGSFGAEGTSGGLAEPGVSLRVGTGTPFTETFPLPRRRPVGPSVFAAGSAALVGTAHPCSVVPAGWVNNWKARHHPFLVKSSVASRIPS